VARTPWRNTTHDWAVGVDLAHLTAIRRDPALFAQTGAIHLALEVLAYVADEAACGHGGRCHISLFADGSISIADDGRGTDTRRGPNGCIVKKPVLSSKGAELNNVYATNDRHVIRWRVGPTARA
jgi:topoisomerase-4 subunit B